MVKSQSFSEILEEMSIENTLLSSEKSTYLEENLIYGFSQILGTTPTYKFTLKSPYLKSMKAKPSPEPHQLNSLQQKAFCFFRELGLELSVHFSWKELKSIYRQSLLKTHPDHGGSSEKFHEVRNNFEILSVLVTNKA